MAIMPTQKEKSSGWGTFFALVFLLYFLLKSAGWWYSLQAQRLMHQLDNVRPTLAQIALFHDLETSKKAYSRAIEQMRAMDLDARQVLDLFSDEVPVSITLEAVDLHPLRGLRVRGMVLPGIRTPEEAILSWIQFLQRKGYTVKIQELLPDGNSPGMWRFQLKMEMP